LKHNQISNFTKIRVLAVGLFHGTEEGQRWTDGQTWPS